MKRKLLFLLLTICFGFDQLSALDADTSKLGLRKLRVYNTIRLSGEKPEIDGNLNDGCWLNEGKWAGNFTQWVPNEGAKPSQKTELKILYDDKNIYVAIRAYDNEPEKIIRKAGRRDEFSGDMVGINFDSYHDHRTGFEFNVSAAGQKVDLLLTNPVNADVSWDAVWYVKTGMEDSAWTAEFQIPLSQLRYSDENEQVWGLHCWRWIDRLQEESDWEPQTSQGPGALYLFGELHGISGLPSSRRIEILPYTSGELNTFKKEPGNPYADKGRKWNGNLGLDAKIGLSSNFTANVTFNPDFGQVESDPSVMNLTAFETFYDEKRPFFLEGKNIFDFSVGGANLFYSRRIGQSPSFHPDLMANEYADFPDKTAIISAVKISGKTSDGLAIGVLQSLTANEYADVKSTETGKERSVKVEPLTNYAIIRVQQDFEEGNSVLGGIITATNRFTDDAYLNFMNRDAYTGGIDLLHQWNNKEFYVDAKIIGSAVTGSNESIRILQNSPARYYSRIDADHLDFDSKATSLTGHGGSVKIGKGSVGHWRYYASANWNSPGLELNDLGYMQTSDNFSEKAAISYFITNPVSIFRSYNIEINQFNNWDFGWNHLSSGAGLSIYSDFLNNWSLNYYIRYTSETLDTRLLRGGPAMLLPSELFSSVYARTDPSSNYYFDFNGEFSVRSEKSADYFSVNPGVAFLPMNTLKFSASVNYSENTDKLQYIETLNNDNGPVYLLGKIEQKTLGLTFRIDYNITPEFSIQYYGSPFASVGKYSEFKTAAKTTADNYSERFMNIHPALAGDSYIYQTVNHITPSSIADNFNFTNPDFNFFQFRSNLVLRWEYKPGSQIYLVWS